MTAETDIGAFMVEIRQLTPRIAAELAVDWGRLVQKIETNLAAIHQLGDLGDGHSIDFLDEIREIIRDKHSRLAVRIFDVFDKFEQFQRDRLWNVTPDTACITIGGVPA